MAVPALDATVGGANSNTYCTLDEANAYHASTPYGTAWDAFDDDAKAQALITATRLLDEHVQWEGVATDSIQVLAWPRGGVYTQNGYSIQTDVLPDGLKRATAEYARQLLASDRTADSDVETQGIKRLKAGPVELEFRDDVQAKVVPDSVWSMVKLWAVMTNGVSVPLVRV